MRMSRLIGGRLTHSVPATSTPSGHWSPRTWSGTCPVGTRWPERSAVVEEVVAWLGRLGALGFTLREHDVLGNDEHVCALSYMGAWRAGVGSRDPRDERVPLPRRPASRAVAVPRGYDRLGRHLQRLTPWFVTSRQPRLDYDSPMRSLPGSLDGSQGDVVRRVRTSSRQLRHRRPAATGGRPCLRRLRGP